jgi:hypothetical protein
MTTDRSELEQRRDELTRSLPVERHTSGFVPSQQRRVGRDRAGVKHEQPDEMIRLAKAEVVADEAIRDVQRELRDLDAEIKLAPSDGVGATSTRAVARLIAEGRREARLPQASFRLRD